MSDLFLVALALMLVVEGLVPALDPARFRQAIEQLARCSDQTLRTLGLCSMIAGALVLLAR